MKILITGSTGLLGQALITRLALRCEVVGLSRHPLTTSSTGHHVVCDLADRQETLRVVHDLRPDVVIHAQALSDVDRCEQDPALARRMNVQTTAHVAQALRASHTWLVYVSTDYVFDGAKGAPYEESDATRPLNVYGRSKLEGERVALEHPFAVVVRPSTLFGSGRENFCDHIVTQLRRGAMVQAFVDQVTSPTYTKDLAEGLEALSAALPSRASGSCARVVHMTNAGGCSRVAFAERIAQLLGQPSGLIERVRMADQQRPAPRPAYSALATTVLPTLIGRTLRSWDEALQAYLCQRHWLN